MVQTRTIAWVSYHLEYIEQPVTWAETCVQAIDMAICGRWREPLWIDPDFKYGHGWRGGKRATAEDIIRTFKLMPFVEAAYAS